MEQSTNKRFAPGAFDDDSRCSKKKRLTLPYLADAAALCDAPLFSEMLSFDTENLIVSNLFIKDVYTLRLVCQQYRRAIDHRYNQLIIDWNILVRRMHPINYDRALRYEEMEWVYMPLPIESLSWPRVVSLNCNSFSRSLLLLDSLKEFPFNILGQTKILLLDFDSEREIYWSGDRFFRELIDYLPKGLEWIIMFGCCPHRLIEAENPLHRFSIFDWIETVADHLQLPPDHFLFTDRSAYTKLCDRDWFLKKTLFSTSDHAIATSYGSETENYIQRLVSGGRTFGNDCHTRNFQWLFQHHMPTFEKLVSNGAIKKRSIKEAIDFLIVCGERTKECAQVIMHLINHAGTIPQLIWEPIRLYPERRMREYSVGFERGQLHFLLCGKDVIEGFHDALVIALIRSGASPRYIDTEDRSLPNFARLDHLSSWQKFKKESSWP